MRSPTLFPTALVTFVEANRLEIDVRIRIEAPDFPLHITDEDRALWVLTIEPIADWAASKGLII